MRGIQWYTILNKVNSDLKLNQDTIINKITEAVLTEHPDINFNLNNVELLHIAIDYNTKNAAKEKGRVDTINIINALLETDIKNVDSINIDNVDVDSVDLAGETLLLRATRRKDIGINVIEAIVNKGADVNAACFISEKTSLHNAAFNNRADILNFLLEKGANLHATDILKDTALHVAASNDNAEAVEVLLRKGADILLKNRYGNTPIDKTKKGNIKQLMEKALSELHRMKDEKIGTINDKDVSLHEFFKTNNRKQLLRYYSNDRIHDNILEYLDKYAITDKRPIYYDVIEENLHKGVQLQTCYSAIEDDFKEAAPSYAGVYYLTPEIAKYLTDTDIKKVVEKAFTTTKS